MKGVVVAVMATLAIVPLFAEDVPAAKDAPAVKKEARKLTPEEREQAKAAYYKRSGGLCTGMTEGKRYLFLDVTSAGIDTDYERTFKQMEAGCNIRPLVERQPLNGQKPFDLAREVMKTRKDVAALTIFYEGGADDPIESVFPMERFALVNIAPYKTNDKVVFRHRMNAVLWRAFVFTAGGISTGTFDCVMKNVTGVKGVDALTAPVASPVFVQGIVNAAQKDFGFAMCRRGTYERACQEGWAPAPTNDLQKAIWERVRALPDKPIKIEFDPKTDAK